MTWIGSPTCCHTCRNKVACVLHSSEYYLCPACSAKEDEAFDAQQTENRKKTQQTENRKKQPAKKDGNDESGSTPNSGSSANREAAEQQAVDVENRTEHKEKVILHPLLTYVVSGVHAGTSNNVKNAVMSHFTLDEIVNAKSTLFKECSEHKEIIGEIQRRRTTNVRTEREAHVTDIITAITQLDVKNKLPVIAVRAEEFLSIPKSLPEELNQVSVVDRLNVVESVVNDLKILLERTLLENVQLKEDVKQLKRTPKSYAATCQDTVRVAVANKENSQIPSAPHVVKASASQSNLGKKESEASKEEDKESKASTEEKLDQSLEIIDHQVTKELPRKQQMQSNIGAASRAGPSKKTNQKDTSIASKKANQKDTSIAPKKTNQQDTSIASATSDDESDTEFVRPSYHLKKALKKERRRQKVIKGKCNASEHVRGAPVPSRSLFVFRVDKSATTEDMRKHIEANEIMVRQIECMSHADASFKSFKVTVSVEDLEKIMDENIWPSGVNVRQFYQRREKPAKSDN